MPDLLVRNIDIELVNALKAKAGNDGISAEAEHRKILEIALLRPQKKSFAEIISLMPDVGKDSDFERVQDNKTSNVFD